MRALSSVVGLLLVLGVGYFVWQRGAVGNGAHDQRPPVQQIDVVGIRQHLLAIGQAERQYLVTHSQYATLAELASDDLLPGGTESRGYTFTAVPSGSERFTVTAVPTDPDKSTWPTLEIKVNRWIASQQ